jgi:PKD repeat protein
VAIPLTATGGGTLTWRVVNQPSHGSVAMSNNIATYLPDAGFIGADSFTYAANSGWVDSTNLGTGTVTVNQGPYSLGIVAQVPTNAPAGWPTPFNVFATPVNTALPVSFKWNFGDGSSAGTNQFATHVLASAGIYSWQVVATVGTVSATNAGNIAISAPVALAVAPPQNSSLSLSWPQSMPDVVVEQTDTLGTNSKWTTVTNLPVIGPNNSSVNLPVAGGNRFFRVRQPW